MKWRIVLAYIGTDHTAFLHVSLAKIVKSCATILALENMKFCINSCSLGPSENLFDVNGKETNGSEIDEILNFTATLKSYGKLHNFNASNATAIVSNLSNLNTSVLNTSVLNTSVLYEGQNQTISSTAHAFFEEGWDNIFKYIVMLILILCLLGLFAAIKYFKQTLLISRRRSISSVLPLPDIESMTHGTHDAISTSDMVIQNVIDDLICRISDTNIESLNTQPEFRTAFCHTKVTKTKEGYDMSTIHDRLYSVRRKFTEEHCKVNFR